MEGLGCDDAVFGGIVVLDEDDVVIPFACEVDAADAAPIVFATLLLTLAEGEEDGPALALCFASSSSSFSFCF